MTSRTVIVGVPKQIFYVFSLFSFTSTVVFLLHDSRTVCFYLCMFGFFLYAGQTEEDAWFCTEKLAAADKKQTDFAQTNTPSPPVLHRKGGKTTTSGVFG